MHEAGGMMGFIWDRAPVVPSCPLHVHPTTKGHIQVSRLPRIKERGGSNSGYRLEEGWSLFVWVWVFCDSALCHPFHIPVPSTHNHSERASMTRRPCGLWYIYKLGEVSIQRRRLVRSTWANINFLYAEPLMCRGQSFRSSPLSRLISERRVFRVNRQQKRHQRSDERLASWTLTF